MDAFDERPLWTTFKYGLAACLLILAIGAVLIPFGWGFAWLNESARITGPGNTRDQSAAIIGNWNELKATAGNVCAAKSNGGSGSNDPQLLEDPAFAYKATYRRIKADYDRRMANLFEAGLVRHYPNLNGYPRTAPTLKEAMAEEGC